MDFSAISFVPNIPDLTVGDIIAVDADDQGYGFIVGRNDVTAITMVEKNGNVGPIPYLQIWMGSRLAIELCQHAVFAVHYEKVKASA